VAATRRFILANRRASERLEPFFPQTRSDLHVTWGETVARHAKALPDGAVVVDAGGGKACKFKPYLPAGKQLRLVAVDVSEEELRHNTDVDEWRVADITRTLPFANGEVDMLVTRSVVEHLEDPSGFVAETMRVLKPGGRTIHIIPGKFGLVSVVNQLLPRSLARRVVHFVVPGSEGSLGFPAYYRRTYPTAFSRLLREAGFDLEELDVSFSQGYYFASLVPLYVLVSLFEVVLERLRARNLAALFLVVARKPS
jgi:ubiquinone/menaquinone biosynthesis C-methylase UbiE